MAKKKDEVGWTKDVLIPHLRRLGFTRVDFVHGTLEAGRDVVFADHDRFGLLKYYGAQVKDGDLGDRAGSRMSEVIDQLKNAWNTAYEDPSTGTRHRLAGVYLIVNGKVTEAARKTLRENTGQWLHVVDLGQLSLALEGAKCLTDVQWSAALQQLYVETGFWADALRPVSVDDSDRELPPGVHIFSLGPFVPAALCELHTCDGSFLVQLQMLLAEYNHCLLKMPIGSVDPVPIERSWSSLVRLYDRVRSQCLIATALIAFVIGQKRPAPGQRLPGCPTVLADYYGGDYPT